MQYNKLLKGSQKTIDSQTKWTGLEKHVGVNFNYLLTAVEYLAIVPRVRVTMYYFYCVNKTQKSTSDLQIQHKVI